MSNLSGRDTLRMLAASTEATAIPARAKAVKITVMNWKGCRTEEDWSLKAFKAATGIKVDHDYFSTVSEELTKLRTNPGAYDVVLFKPTRVSTAAIEGLIVPADLTKIPNSADVTPELLANPNFTIDGKLYAVPWV